MVHLLPLAAKDRGDLFQIAAPDILSNAAKQEINMIELKRFQLSLATNQSNAFDFERASLALLSMHQHRRVTVQSLPVPSEWRDPVPFRCDKLPDMSSPHEPSICDHWYIRGG
jgi:hypothetical protein